MQNALSYLENKNESKYSRIEGEIVCLELKKFGIEISHLAREERLKIYNIKNRKIREREWSLASRRATPRSCPHVREMVLRGPTRCYYPERNANGR